MSKDYLNVPPTTVRRDDREVTDEAWIKQFLHRAAVGTLATVHDGQPFINTNLFVYDEPSHTIIMHTARKGRTRANVEQENKVCFSIMEMGRLLPADESLEFSVEYGGVVVFGRSEMVEDEAEALRLLQLIMDKYAPHLTAGTDYRPPIAEEFKRTSVFRIHIDAMSAKKKEVEDFEGAYWYPDNPMLASVRKRPLWQGTLDQIMIASEAEGTIQSVDCVEAVSGQGLRGDRYFGKVSDDPAEATEVTLIAAEDLEAVRRETTFQIEPEQTRRNLLTRGVALNHLLGKRFAVGDVILEGRQLCDPCSGMANAAGYGKPLTVALLNRGGLRAVIIKGGTIHAGDVLRPVD